MFTRNKTEKMFLSNKQFLFNNMNKGLFEIVVG